jgi:hypothetical protein
MSALVQLRQLTSLNLTCVKQATDEGLAALSTLTSLTFVDRWCCANISSQHTASPCCLAQSFHVAA